MRFTPTYRDFQLGRTTASPTSGPYASRRDPGDEDFSWTRYNAERLPPSCVAPAEDREPGADR